MQFLNGVTIVTAVLLLHCGVFILGDDSKENESDRSRGFSWLDFFKAKHHPSTPALPIQNVKLDRGAGGGGRGPSNSLFDEIQMANDILELENELLDQEYERRMEQGKPRKLPADMFCKKEQKEALDTFCTHLKEGYYYDPWNPFCGFIRCRRVDSEDRKPHMVATREVCREGTWVSDQSQRMRHGQDNICRVALEIDISDGDICMGGAITRSSNMCAPAKRVLQMNDKTELFE